MLAKHKWMHIPAKQPRKREYSDRKLTLNTETFWIVFYKFNIFFGVEYTANCTALVMALASFPSTMLAKGASEEPQHSVY